MKASLIFIATLAVLLFSMCEPPVVFTEPQPRDINPQMSFNMFYRGTFFCESDSAIVHINNKTVYKEKSYPFSLAKKQIDEMEGTYLRGNRLYIDSIGAVLPATVIRDSVFAELILRDTLFNIGRDQVLTEFRGHQILNRKLENGNWEVAILSLEYSFDLLLSMAKIPDDLDRLQQITPVTDLSRGDTIQYLISPSVYEFSQILEEELIFEACDYYRRIALPSEI